MELERRIEAILEQRRVGVAREFETKKIELGNTPKTSPSYGRIASKLQDLQNRLEEVDGQGGELRRHFQRTLRPLDGPEDDDRPRVEIVVLNYRLPRVEQRCACCLIEHTDWPYQLSFYDGRPHTSNFSKMWNRLTRRSFYDYVLIMDSDAYVSSGWLSTMMEPFQPGFTCHPTSELALRHSDIMFEPQVGVVVPATQPGGATTIQAEPSIHELREPFAVNQQVSGFFFLFKKQVFEEVGPFDERFYLHGQDSEWFDRVLASRWSIIVHPGVKVEHQVSASIRKAAEEGEVNLDVEREYTQVVYDLIREEKKAGTFTPYAE